MAISAQHTKFETNEYISALPADDLIKVAMKKQEMYDEGRAKIKQTVDSYAKLRNSMVSDVHKNYLDQELNKLTKNIQSNAGLDFANIGNVEAVLNLGKPFENDEYIRIGLQNGQEAQRRTSYLNSLPKGSRNADNDALFMKDYNQMLQNGGLDTKLVQNKTYEEYVDISAELAKIEKDVKGEMSTVYGQGPKGYFEKIDIERKTAQQVYERAMASLSPAQQRQLQIHAEAEMDRLGPQAVYQTWVGHNKQEKLSVEQNLKSAKMEIAQLENKKALTAADKANLNSLYAIKEDAEATINAIDQNVQMNPDEFDMGEYVPFFTKRFISGFAQKFAFETKKTDLKTDEVYMKTLEHGQQLSRIAAQGRETRLNAQFQNDITNYQVSSGVSIGALKNIDNYLQGANIDVSKPPLEQVDAMIAAIQKLDPDAKNPVIRARQKESYLRELDQLKNLYNMLQQGGEFDKISLNRSAGLGQVQTSIADLMSRPVIDLLKSGNTLEYMRYNPKSTTKTKSTATPEEKGNFDAKKKYNYYSSTYDLINPKKPGQSDADYNKEKQEYIKKQLSKETTTASVIIGGEG